MTTLASPEIKAYADAWEDLYPSAVLSGIVGDLAHKLSGGYHISIEDQRATNYSVTRPKDKAPPGNWSRQHASAVDMSMSTADMIVAWNRVYAVWLDRTDPRRVYFNAFNGWNGKGEAERLDFIANTRTTATSDHKWHCHDETCRCYWNDPVAFKAKLSVYSGQSKADYIANGAAASDSGGSFNMLCKFGDKGPIVGALQALLLGLGYSPGNVDQDYGDKTAAALKAALNDPSNNGKNYGPWEYAAIMVRNVRDGGTGKGEKGDPGEPGPQGEQGPKGDKGDAAVLPEGATLTIVTE